MLPLRQVGEGDHVKGHTAFVSLRIGMNHSVTAVNGISGSKSDREFLYKLVDCQLLDKCRYNKLHNG